MTAQPVDLAETLKKIRYDLTAAQGKVTEALNLLAELNLPEPTTVSCDTCGWTFRHGTHLEEHVYHHHDGPLPAHWAAADARVAG